MTRAGALPRINDHSYPNRVGTWFGQPEPSATRATPPFRMATMQPQTTSPDQSEDGAAIVALAREFAATEIAPLVQSYDEAESIPRDLLAKMGALGFFGGVISEEDGGLGLDFVTF